MTKYTTEGLIGIAISAITYALLFYLNDWLTQYVAYGLGVSWIYLPAGLRLFLTLIFGFPGALGIALATWVSSRKTSSLALVLQSFQAFHPIWQEYLF